VLWVYRCDSWKYTTLLNVECHGASFFLRCRVLVDNDGDHVMPEQSVFCRPDELGWAYVILQTCTQTVQILLSLSFSCSSPFTFPVNTSASMSCLLMTCPKKSSCLCLIVFINVRWTPAALRTSRLLFFSVHEIFRHPSEKHIHFILNTHLKTNYYTNSRTNNFYT